MNFEEAIKRLEELAKLMESDQIALDDSVKYFEEGVKLYKECLKKLEKTEQKIKIVLKDVDNKSFETSEFDEKP